jgi:Fur family ferric uptake transcriptional regulator
MSRHYPDLAELATFFEKRGLRWTVQRQLILDTVQRHSGHLSVEEIYAEVVRAFPSVNRSTVYRTLELLSEIGIIVEIQGRDNLRRYEIVSASPHYHALCEGCGGEIELESDLVKKLIQQVWEQYKVKLNIGHFVGMGICPHCQELVGLPTG